MSATPQTAAVNAMRRGALVVRELLQSLRETAGSTTLASPDDAGRLVDRVIAVATACDPVVTAISDAADGLDMAPTVAPASDQAPTERCTELTRRAAYEIEQLCNLALRENNEAIAAVGTEIDYALQGMLIRLRTLGCAVMSLTDTTPARPTNDQVDEYEAEIVGFSRGANRG